MIQWLTTIWAVVLVKLRIRKPPKNLIPSGMYCYKLEIKPNNNCDMVRTKICPYFVSLKAETHSSPGINACKYLGTITTDCVFNDQCKICGENDE